MIAARAGAKIDPAAPVSACSNEMATKLGNSGMASVPAVTVIAPTTTNARLADVRSTSAPTGVCATIAAMPPIPITSPIDA